MSPNSHFFQKIAGKDRLMRHDSACQVDSKTLLTVTRDNRERLR